MTTEDLLEYISPTHMWEYASNKERARSNDRATLEESTRVHGFETICKVVYHFLTDFTTFVKCRNLPTTGELKELCYIFVIEYKYLKITEIPLFFCALKAGKYGKFYNTLDPQDITSALKEFADESRTHSKRERERAQKEAAEQEREQSRARAIRFEEAVREGLLNNIKL